MKIYIFVMALFLSACSSNESDSGNTNYTISSLVDSTSTRQTTKDTSEHDLLESPQETNQDALASVLWDTVGVSMAPIRVIKAWLYRREYSTYKDIALTYKNVSNKKVTAIRFRWYGITAFGDPADMGTSLKEGFGGGFTEDAMRPGAVRTSEWSILSRNGKKVVQAWPTEIMFEDGTKWKPSNR